MKLDRIFPECFADTLLVSRVIRVEMQLHYIGQSMGFGGVSNAMEDYAHPEHVIIGVTDNDFKRTPTFIKKFIIKDNRESSEGLILHHLPDTNKYLIKICPAIEKWLWSAAQTANVKTESISDWQDLRKAKHQNDLDANKYLAEFLDALITANPAPIQTLRQWLSMVNDL